MQISGLGSIQPLYYNTNILSTNSMNRISGISDNLSSRKTDFSGLTSADSLENENPLKPGQSANFMDILNSQMQMSRTNQSRVMTEPAVDQPDTGAARQAAAIAAPQQQQQQAETLYRQRIPNEAMLQMLFGQA